MILKETKKKFLYFVGRCASEQTVVNHSRIYRQIKKLTNEIAVGTFVCTAEQEEGAIRKLTIKKLSTFVDNDLLKVQTFFNCAGTQTVCIRVEPWVRRIRYFPGGDTGRAKRTDKSLLK